MTIIGWLAALILTVLLAACLRGCWTARTADKLACRSLGIAACFLACLDVITFTLLGALPPAYLLFAAVAAASTAVLVLTDKGTPWESVRDAGKHAGRVLGGHAGNGAPAAADPARPVRAAAPPRHLRIARAAPQPLPPVADPGNAAPRLNAGSRYATVSRIIPPDHAAAHQRIASFEPDGLLAHAGFLTGEGRAFTGYVEAFSAYADNLIHGPGVPPEALRALFEFADMFAEVGSTATLALKKFHDYFAGHLEWAESHDPTRDGHWTIRE